MANSKNGNSGQEQIDPATGEFVPSDNADAMQIDRRLYRKTLTSSTIEATPERCVVAKRPVMLFRIGGEVRGTARAVLSADIDKPEAQQHTFTALVGSFSADVYGDGGEVIAEYHGGQAYLPTGFHDAALTQFANAIEDADKGGYEPSFRFNLEFAAEPASNPRGYRWIARNLMGRAVGDLHDVMQAQAALARQSRELPSLTDRRPAQQQLAGPQS